MRVMSYRRFGRGRLPFFLMLLATAALISSAAMVGGVKVSANHPVLVEGNCDSPVPGTTIVTAGTCGDWDGDGRIGTAEDTDGADRIFGTIAAALGPGTGAAAGTGANHNGTVRIVTSGRFAESLFIGQNVSGPGAPGAAVPGNVTLEAAPGVHADINAVLQGDPAGGNATRQGSTGITVIYTTNGATNVVTLRNLSINNWNIGIESLSNTRLVMDNCRLSNNLSAGIRLFNTTRSVITNSKVEASGFRTGSGGSSTPNPGNGIELSGTAQARIVETTISHNANCGIANFTGSATNAQVYKVSAFFNNNLDSGGVCGAITVAANPNFASN